MKRLNELIDTNIDTLIKGIKINSKNIEEGDLFLCTSGVNFDRHDFIDDAVKNGAVAAVVSKDVEAPIPLVKVKNVDEVFPLIYQRFYDHPEKDIKILTVGGTDGKTSTTTILRHLLGEETCAYIGTNGAVFKTYEKELANTTPDADVLYREFRAFLDRGAKYVALETSSEAYFRNRLRDLTFDVAGFTNITTEHLNVHKTFENYLECKLRQMDHLKKGGLAVLNMDDKHFLDFKNRCREKIITYGMNKEADLYIKSFTEYKDHTDIIYVYKGKEYMVNSPLLGGFNVYNLACALLMATPFQDFEASLKKVNHILIKGRMEFFNFNGIDIILDYAHTTNGVNTLFNYVRKIGYKHIYTVIGQAGGRDKSKRKYVGKIVYDNSTKAIFTAEDSRSEEFMDIIKDITEYIDGSDYLAIENRKEAIKKAISLAKKGDAVLILGKGREEGNIIKGEVIKGSDYDFIMEVIHA